MANPINPSELLLDIPPVSSEAIATVLSLVNEVCGPESDVARMLGLIPTQHREQVA